MPAKPIGFYGSRAMLDEPGIWAIALHQPWASMIMAGLKPFETRSWAPQPDRIGQRIAIHATKQRLTPDLEAWARSVGLAPPLPMGAILGTVRLSGAYRLGNTQTPGGHLAVGHARVVDSVSGSYKMPIGIRADDYGDYGIGRWAWLLTEITPFEHPVPERGHQGWWKWNG